MLGPSQFAAWSKRNCLGDECPEVVWDSSVGVWILCVSLFSCGFYVARFLDLQLAALAPGKTRRIRVGLIL